MNNPIRKNAARVLCLLLAGTMTLASCAKSEPDAAQNTSSVPQSDAPADAAETEAPETEAPKPLEYLGAHDFEGRTYTVLVSGMDNSEWRQNNIDADAENPEIINSSRFNRNIEVEDTLNVAIASIEQFGNGGIVMGELKAAVKANDEIYNSTQLCMTDAAKITLEGYFADLMTLPGVSLSEPWWDARAVEDMTIRGQLYQCRRGRFRRDRRRR